MGKPKVMQFPWEGHWEWAVLFQGEYRFFIRWADAVHYAYTIARVRNVAADALGGLS